MLQNARNEIFWMEMYFNELAANGLALFLSVIHEKHSWELYNVL